MEVREPSFTDLIANKNLDSRESISPEYFEYVLAKYGRLGKTIYEAIPPGNRLHQGRLYQTGLGEIDNYEEPATHLIIGQADQLHLYLFNLRWWTPRRLWLGFDVRNCPDATTDIGEANMLNLWEEYETRKGKFIAKQYLIGEGGTVRGYRVNRRFKSIERGQLAKEMLIIRLRDKAAEQLAPAA